MFGQFRPISTNLGDFGPFKAISAILGQTPQTPSRPYPASNRTAPTNSTLLGGGGGGRGAAEWRKRKRSRVRPVLPVQYENRMHYTHTHTQNMVNRWIGVYRRSVYPGSGPCYRQQRCVGRVQQLHLFCDLLLPLALTTIGDNKVKQLDRREVRTTTRVTFGGGRWLPPPPPDPPTQ
jgi:hypothetical protein